MKIESGAGAGAMAGRGITLDKLIELYDSHGIHPTMVQAVAAQEGIAVDVPDNFTALVASRHAGEKRQAEKTMELPGGLSATDAVYYSEPERKEFDGRVLLAMKDEKGREQLILDRSAFYPEGGGQHADRGFMEIGGKRAKVVDVQKVDGKIIHTLEEPLGAAKGAHVSGTVDWRRRMAHSRHHTATHIIIGSARKVLGPHVWQAGAEKTERGAHVDISHFDKVTLEQVHEIEREANEIVAANLPVGFTSLPREEAERRYGMSLYQGGAPAGPVIRVVRVGEFDSQACGGTHTGTSGEVGLIKITRAERIQDGVVRLEYSASIAALAIIQKLEKQLLESASELSVQPEQLPATVKRFFGEWKDLKKLVAEMKTRIALERSINLMSSAIPVGAFKIVSTVENDDFEVARNVAIIITEREPVMICIIGSRLSKGIILASGEKVSLQLGDVAKELCRGIGGSGGGKSHYAQIGGIPSEKLDESLNAAKELIRKLLSK